ncbi:MAG: endonuclease Q family protein [Patescibacteria group bacterium]|nr:endonuclease Q family protein [Patescibacteria group bacterium]
MKQILDLHIHSKYSRACSGQLTLENIDAACRVKGIDVIATGDFTYPQWFEAIKNELEEINGGGLYQRRNAISCVPIGEQDKNLNAKYCVPTKFILSTEVALIYKDGGPHARRIHLVIMAPNIEAAGKLNNYLDKNFNIRSDGRPILGMSAPDLVKTCLDIHPQFLIYPAHIWTPWFSVFGSKSGFDKMEECFREQTKNIYAYETGLSSDPEMNWRLSALDNLTLLSNSDAHSLANLGRECNVFDLNDFSYQEIYGIIKNKDLKKIVKTIEFYPEEGMYHYDGHLTCGISFMPSETKKHKGICPVCKKPLTIGVLNRVEELADRPSDIIPKKSYPFVKLVELDKIIAEALGVKSRSSTKVKAEYDKLIKNFGPELFILMDLPLDKLAGRTLPLIAEGIKRVREGKLAIKPGFDGQYGEIKIFTTAEKLQGKTQKPLF